LPDQIIHIADRRIIAPAKPEYGQSTTAVLCAQCGNCQLCAREKFARFGKRDRVVGGRRIRRVLALRRHQRCGFEFVGHVFLRSNGVGREPSADFPFIDSIGLLGRALILRPGVVLSVAVAAATLATRISHRVASSLGAAMAEASCKSKTLDVRRTAQRMPWYC
jgi:hypothetical protein